MQCDTGCNVRRCYVTVSCLTAATVKQQWANSKSSVTLLKYRKVIMLASVLIKFLSHKLEALANISHINGSLRLEK